MLGRGYKPRHAAHTNFQLRFRSLFGLTKTLGQGGLARWVGLATRRPISVLVLAVALTLGAGYATITTIGINTNTTDMLSEDLAFRRNDAAMRAAFPQFTDVLSIVVEAESPDDAAAAAASLTQDLSARPELFRSVFYAEGEPFFRRNGLLYLDLAELQALSDRLARAQPLLAALNEDLSLRGLAEVMDRALKEALAPGEQAVLAPMLERMSETARAVAAAQGDTQPVRPMSWASILSGVEPTPHDKRRFVLAQPVLDYTSLEPAADAIDAVRRRAAALGLDERAGVRVRLTGSTVMFQDELRSVQSGMGLVGLLSLVLVSVLLAIGLRLPRLIFAVLATLIMGLIWTAGFAALAVGELNLISVAFAVLFIGLSVDFGIHFVLRYREAADKGIAGDALVAAARGVGGPLTLSAVAAAIGFFAFLPTSYRGLSELGLISGAGMFIALFANLTVLPAILSLFPALRDRGARDRDDRAPSARQSFGSRMQGALGARRRAVLGGALVLGLGALMALPFARFDDDPFNLRDPDTESVSTLNDLIEDPRVQPYSADLLAPNLARAEVLATELEQQPEVEAAITIGDYIPTQQDDKLAIVEEMSFFLLPLFQGAGPGQLGAPPDAAARQDARNRLRDSLRRAEGRLAAPAGLLIAALDEIGPNPQRLMVLETALLSGLRSRLDDLGEALEARPVGLKDLPAALRDRNLTADGRAKIEIVPRNDLRDAAARRRFVDAVVAVAPSASGAPITITEAGRAVVRAFLEAAGIAVVAIVVLLLTVLRSLRDSALVLAPLLLAALLTVAATVVFGVPFNFANVIVLPLLFGLGVAGGIHVVVRARDAGARGLATTSTPGAVVLSSLTTIASFCALALSNHRGTSSMGVLLTIAITLTLVTTLVVLPALLVQVERTPNRKSS